MKKSVLSHLAHELEAPDWFTVLTLRMIAPFGYRCQTDPGQALQVYEDKKGRLLMVKPACPEPGTIVGLCVLVEGEIFAALDMRRIQQWAKRSFGSACQVVFLPTEEPDAGQFCVKYEGKFVEVAPFL